MSEKRLFNAQITESDAFIAMSYAAQCLYFHYCMNADDDGFIKNPKSIARMLLTDDSKVESSKAAYNELIESRFIIELDNGVIVVKHWHIHNLIRKDRYKETEYTEQREKLYIKPNGAYTLDKDKGKRYIDYLNTKELPKGCQVTTASKDEKPRTSKKDALEKWGGVSRESTDYNELMKQVVAN